MYSESFEELKKNLNLDDLGLTDNDLKIPKLEDTYGNAPETEKPLIALEDIPASIPMPNNMPVNEHPPGPVFNPSYKPGVSITENTVNHLQNSLVNNIISKPEKPSFPNNPMNVNNSFNSMPPELKAPPQKDNNPPLEAEKPKEKFTRDEKEAVIASFITQEKFTKKFKLNNLFSIVLKTISDDDQHILNETLQKIDLMGDKRKHAYFYGSGTGEEFDVYHHVDSMRQRRLTILIYHLDSLCDNKIPDGEEGRVKAREAVSKLPTNLINAIYSKCMIPFLDLVEEACGSIEVF